MHSQIQYHLYQVSTPKYHWWFVDLSESITTRKEGEKSKSLKASAVICCISTKFTCACRGKSKKVDWTQWKTLETTSVRFQSHPFSCFLDLTMTHDSCFIYVHLFLLLHSLGVTHFGTRPLGPLGRLPPPSSAPHCWVPCPLYFPNLKDVKRHSWHHKFSYRFRFQKV